MQAYVVGSTALVIVTVIVLAVFLLVALVVAGVVIVLTGFVLTVADAVRDHRATSREQSMMVPTDQPQEES